jgi:nitroreductase
MVPAMNHKAAKGRALAMNGVLDVIRKRRSIRKYQPIPIREEELTAILEAGRSAPSGGNNQTSHFIVISNPAVLCELTGLVRAEFAKMELKDGMYKSLEASIRASKKGGYDFIYHAPVLVVAANRKGYGNAMADCACALQNMMLAACSLDIGSCWINQLHWLDDNEVIRTFMLDHGLCENETICGALSLGYPAQEEHAPLPRTGNNITYIR